MFSCNQICCSWFLANTAFNFISASSVMKSLSLVSGTVLVSALVISLSIISLKKPSESGFCHCFTSFFCCRQCYSLHCWSVHFDSLLVTASLTMNTVVNSSSTLNHFHSDIHILILVTDKYHKHIYIYGKMALTKKI